MRWLRLVDVISKENENDVGRGFGEERAEITGTLSHVLRSSNVEKATAALAPQHLQS